METINGKQYPLWSQFVDRKKEWIGSTLEDFGDRIDKAMHRGKSRRTRITDITLTPNGETSALFSVVGRKFTCSGDVRYLGVMAGEEGWLTLSGFQGHEWRFKKKGKRK